MQFVCDCGEIWQPKFVTDVTKESDFEKWQMSRECKFCGQVPSFFEKWEKYHGEIK